MDETPMQVVVPENRNVRSVGFGFAVCCAGMMSLAIGINLLPVFCTTLQATMGLNNEQFGRIGSVTFVGVVGAIFATGPLADRFGPKLFALIGNALVAVGLAALALSRSYNAVLVASFVLGVGAGTLDMVLSPIVGALKPENKSSAMNWLHSFYCTGSVLTVLIAAGALKLNIGWRTTSAIMIVLPVLVIAGFMAMRVPALVHESVERHRLRELLRIPYFWAAMAAIALGGATELGMSYWLPAYAEKSLGYTRFIGAMGFTGFLAAMAAGRIGVGVVSTPANVMKLLMLCCTGSAIFIVGASFLPWPGLALACCVLSGLAGSALWPSMLAVAADRFPRGGGTMYAAMGAAGNAGALVMPWIVGVAADHSTMARGLATGAICPLLMLMILLRIREKRAAAEQP